MKKIIEMILEDIISRFDRYGVIHIQKQGGKQK